MISDVLFEAVDEIDRYLTDPAFEGEYEGSVRAWIESLRDEMTKLRVLLDTPPARPMPIRGEQPEAKT